MSRLSALSAIVLALFLCLGAAPAMAEGVTIYPGDEYVVNAGEVQIFELDDDFAYTIFIDPLVDGVLNKGHVAMYALGNIIMEDNLRLGSLYREIDGHKVLIMRHNEWSIDNAVDLYRVVLQVFVGSMRISFN